MSQGRTNSRRCRFVHARSRAVASPFVREAFMAGTAIKHVVRHFAGSAILLLILFLCGTRAALAQDQSNTVQSATENALAAEIAFGGLLQLMTFYKGLDFRPVWTAGRLTRTRVSFVANVEQCRATGTAQRRLCCGHSDRFSPRSLRARQSPDRKTVRCGARQRYTAGRRGRCFADTDWMTSLPFALAS